MRKKDEGRGEGWLDRINRAEQSSPGRTSPRLLSCQLSRRCPINHISSTFNLCLFSSPYHIAIPLPLTSPTSHHPHHSLYSGTALIKTSFGMYLNSYVEVDSGSPPPQPEVPLVVSPTFLPFTFACMLGNSQLSANSPFIYRLWFRRAVN